MVLIALPQSPVGEGRGRRENQRPAELSLSICCLLRTGWAQHMGICRGKGKPGRREASAAGCPGTDSEWEFLLGQLHLVVVRSLLERVWQSREKEVDPSGAWALTQCWEDLKDWCSGSGGR